MTSKDIFNGGNFELNILNAEKYTQNQKIFGKGKYKSYIRILSGNREIGRSIIENAKIIYIDRNTKWGGFDSNLKLMKILPTLKPSIKIIIYDCDRENEDIPLGEAKLILKDTISNNPVTLTLNIESISDNNSNTQQQQQQQTKRVVGSITIVARFYPNPIPTFTLSDKIQLNLSKSKKFFVGIGWDNEFKTPGVNDQSFGASLALFNIDGNHIESTVLPQWKEKKTIKSIYQRIQPIVEDGYTTDKIKISFSLDNHLNPTTSNLLAGHFIISALHDFTSLQSLQNVYCRIVDERSNLEIGRYCLNLFDNPVSSCMIMRLERDIKLSTPEEIKWCIRPGRFMDYTSRSCGNFLPALKSNLIDLFPQSNDNGNDEPLRPPPQPKVSDRIGYIHTPEQTYCLENFYEITEETPFLGDLTVGIRWEEAQIPGKLPTQLDLDLACIVLDNQLNILDRIAGAGVPVPVVKEKPQATEGEGDEDENGENSAQQQQQSQSQEEDNDENSVIISPPPVSINGSIIHGGEIATERQEGIDDHFIQIKLRGVDELPNATYIAIYAASLSGISFKNNKLIGCYSHIFDTNNQQELISYEITPIQSEFSNDCFFTSSNTSSSSGILLYILFKLESKWYVISTQKPLTGSPPDLTTDNIMTLITNYLNDIKPTTLQMRINTHNQTNTKRYGHLTS